MGIVSPATTYGAILLGAFIAFGLSGAISLQCIVYFKMYPNDGTRVKTLVSAVWFLDILHSSFICAALLTYFVTFFGQPEKIDSIPWSIAFTVVVTAIQTFLVHCFFSQKILRASGRSWLITGPILLLALGRLLSACVSTLEMIRLHRFSKFIQVYGGLFTTGLVLSAGVDIIIMGWLCYYLRAIRTRIAPGSTVMIRLVDSITIYMLENGALTCFTTISSLICWLTMPKNLIFFGLHFVIGKLYANSLLASLNVREELQQMRWTTQNQSTRNRLDLTETSSTGLMCANSTDADNLTSMPKQRRVQGVGTGTTNVRRHDRALLRQYQPREPTILEWRAESPV